MTHELHDFTESIPVHNDTRQDDSLSPPLLNIIMDQIIRQFRKLIG